MADRQHTGADARPPHALHRPALAGLLSIGVVVLLGAAVTGLPPVTAALPVIARHAMQIALPTWGQDEVVSEIVYGSRGFDTFGETFLLLAAVVSVALLTRGREVRSEYVGEATAGRREQAEVNPVDRRDSDEALAITLEYCNTPEFQREAVRSLEFKCDVLWSMLDAIHHAYGNREIAAPA